MPTKRRSQSSRWPQALSAISVDATIERLFRFIEMIVIAALIGFALRVVSDEASRWIVAALALMAGYYLGLPIARWITKHILKPSDKNGETNAVMIISLGVSVIVVVATSGLRILLSETFQIDRPRAAVEYRLWNAKLALNDCDGLARPARDVAECKRRWSAEIGNLEAQERLLQSRR